jgi:hypothetical protein
MRTVTTALFLALLSAFGSPIAWAQKEPAASGSLEAALARVVERHFAQWDRDQNGVLDLSEVDHQIENHFVRGYHAAMIVALRDHLTKQENHAGISHEELLKLVKEHGFAKSVGQAGSRLKAIDRELFLPTDPDLETFSQGRVGDCYLLSAIAAQAHRSPDAIRQMIHPEVTGGFQVIFGDGQKIEIPALTECELLLGAKLDQRHGSWLAVLEKSYGTIRRRDRAKKNQDPAGPAAKIVPYDTLNTGNPAVIIALLTGRRGECLRLDQGATLEQVHALLRDETANKRLVCASKNKEKGPPGIVCKHAYAVFGYDAQQRQVHLFNPWGNEFSPKGPAGIANGYPTTHGQFTMPLDEFCKVFYRVEYETDKPIRPANRELRERK